MNAKQGFLEMAEDYNIKIALLLAVGLTYAFILGYLAHRIKLSPIIGYLLAGYMIGPYSPGFVANLAVSEQLAEIGVILMMFGVGLHFKWQELIKVKNIAVPGAIAQTLVAGLCGMFFVYSLGWTIEAGLVIGLSIGVASTVVMVRVLQDNHLLSTPQGHIAVGWLIVEDLITVVALLLLPPLASSLHGESVSFFEIASTAAFAILKCVVLVALMFLFGFRVVSFIFLKIARTRSQELFILTILALTFVIAIGSALLFGTSIALGAFIAGMVIGQTEVRHQASASSLPIKDTFAVIFFLSVGMLFNPFAIVAHFPFFIGILAIILLVKPLVAFLLVRFMKYPIKTAVIVAIALAQIGEFSFILSEEAMRLNILSDEGFDIIVACALISIALNNLLFRICGSLERFFKPSESENKQAIISDSIPRAIVIGFGPVGQAVTYTLEQLGFLPVIIENNVDTVTKLKAQKRTAFFGDASLEHIQEVAHIETADLLVITIPEASFAMSSVKIARQHNPDIKIFARANYLSDLQPLKDMNVEVICSEEETKLAFVKVLENSL